MTMKMGSVSGSTVMGRFAFVLVSSQGKRRSMVNNLQRAEILENVCSILFTNIRPWGNIKQLEYDELLLMAKELRASVLEQMKQDSIRKFEMEVG